MKEHRNNEKPEEKSWAMEIIEQAKNDKKRTERLLFVSIAVNAILAAVIFFR